eukprot:1159320-Pelagomonas_calceolata.AAC.3
MHMHIHTHVHRGCKRLLLYGARVNSCDAFGRSPLHVVLENGRTKVASFLLDQGANRNLQGAVNWFLDKTDQASPCLNLTLVDKEGNTCVLVAAMYGWWDIVDRMLNMMLTPPSALQGADTWGLGLHCTLKVCSRLQKKRREENCTGSESHSYIKEKRIGLRHCVFSSPRELQMRQMGIRRATSSSPCRILVMGVNRCLFEGMTDACKFSAHWT